MTTPAVVKTFRVTKSTDPVHGFNIELEQEDGTFKTETFHAVPKVRGSLILDLVASSTLGAQWQAAAVRKFFAEAVVPDEKDAFFKTIDESDPPIDLTQLVEISNWLVEQYGENPTPPATP